MVPLWIPVEQINIQDVHPVTSEFQVNSESCFSIRKSHVLFGHIYIKNTIHYLQIRCNWAVLYFTWQPYLVKNKKCGFLFGFAFHSRTHPCWL